MITLLNGGKPNDMSKRPPRPKKVAVYQIIVPITSRREGIAKAREHDIYLSDVLGLALEDFISMKVNNDFLERVLDYRYRSGK